MTTRRHSCDVIDISEIKRQRAAAAACDIKIADEPHWSRAFSEQRHRQRHRHLPTDSGQLRDSIRRVTIDDNDEDTADVMSGVGSGGHRRPRRRPTGNKCSEQQFARHVSHTCDISKVRQSLGDGSLKVLKGKKWKISKFQVREWQLLYTC